MGFVINAETVEGAATPTTAVSCLFAASELSELLRSHTSAAFAGKTDAFFYLQNGAVRELTTQELSVGYPALLATAPEGARIVAIRREEHAQGVAQSVTEFYPAP